MTIREVEPGRWVVALGDGLVLDVLVVAEQAGGSGDGAGSSSERSRPGTDEPRPAFEGFDLEDDPGPALFRRLRGFRLTSNSILMRCA